MGKMRQNVNKSVDELTGLVPDRLPGCLKSKNSLLTVLIIAVCATVLITHWPALTAKAISFDDKQYFVDNSLVRSPGWESTRRFLTEILEPSTVGGYYQPLTMISLMLDYAIGGQTDSLVPFHQTSLLLHVANTALIIILLHQLFGRVWIAAVAGLLFGVHPLTVEPIPWIGERKTLLAAFFSLWSLVLYVRFARRGDWKVFLGCVVMYVLALMSKPTSTPLPVAMLLMDFWPLRRLRLRTFLEKLPLFVIGEISAIITYVSQTTSATVITPAKYGLERMPLVICHNIIFYLYKMVWPVNQSSHYAFPDPLEFSTPMIKVGVIGTFILISLLIISLRWTRAALTSWFIFFVMVLPTMQMVQFSNVIASDKFVYLPSIGILMILAAFLSWICGTDGIGQHKAKYIIAAVIVLMLAGAESFATRRYLVYWKDTVSLFAEMAEITPDAISPYYNLGEALAERGDVNGAIESFTKVLKIKPNDTDTHLALARVLADQGRYDEAIYHCNKVLRLNPDNVSAYRYITIALTEQGRFNEAIAMLRKGLEYKPKNSSILYFGLGTIYMQQGKLDQAICELQTSVRLRPDSTTYNNLGVALISKGRIDEAMECHKKAIQLDPKNAEAHFNLANILMSQEKFKQAVDEYEKALHINPKYTKAHINLAAALMEEGQLQDAANEYHQVLQLRPEDADIHCALGDVLVRLGRPDEAAAEYRQALKIDPQHSQAQQGLKSISDRQQSGQTTQ